jgi:serine/threonine-protein kinase
MSEIKEPVSDVPEGATPARPVIPLENSRIDTLGPEFARLLSKRSAQVGEVLAGRYRVLRAIGNGGMGQVFVAENIAIAQKVAIKVLKPELLVDDSFRKRFQKEAEAIAAIEHQNVVRFFDLVIGDPTFLVMELVEGPTLATILHGEQRLQPVRAAELARRLCWGLDAAHRAGIVHRDVKPSNILLAPDAEFTEQPKLIDFGVAKIDSKPTDVQLTRHGEIVGTPHYMSPEQISHNPVDARSDVYSLACVLYHMVAGRPPFVGSQEYKILLQHVEKAPDPVSYLRPGVPPALEAVLHKALAKEPNERFASMQEMAYALAEITRPQSLGGPTEAPTHPMSGLQTKGQGKRRGRLVAVAAISALVAAAAGAGVTWKVTRAGSRSMTSGVIVSSDPSGASVEVDGKPLAETTPAAVSGLAAGSHTVRLRLEGHGDVERQIDVKSGERAMVEISMPARNHRVEVKTAPNAASVWLDGKLVPGTTPTVMTVTDDDFHEVRVERPGYEPLVQSLKPEDRQSELMLTLEPETEPRGVLSVDAYGAAEVWIDGVYSGFTTPTLGLRVRAGVHTVEIRGAGTLHSAPQKVTIRKGEQQHLMMSFVGETKR